MPLTASHRQRDDRRSVDTAGTASAYDILQGKIRRGSVNLRPECVQRRSRKCRQAKYAAATAWSGGVTFVGIRFALVRMAVRRRFACTTVMLLRLGGAVVIICQAVSCRCTIGESKRQRRCDGANAKQNGEHQRRAYPNGFCHLKQHNLALTAALNLGSQLNATASPDCQQPTKSIEGEGSSSKVWKSGRCYRDATLTEMWRLKARLCLRRHGGSFPNPSKPINSGACRRG